MRVVVWSLALVASLLPRAARGQDEAESPPATVITIRPAASPVPALKYSLLPRPEELIPGNAAIFYHRAIERLISIQLRREIQARQLKRPPQEVVAEQDAWNKWLGQPLATLPREAVRKYLEVHDFVLHEVELGARREFCNWEFARRDEGLELNLEDIQETRALGRLLVLKTRLEIAEGRIESAIHWLQTAMALGRHVNESNMLIQSLISSAIITQMAGPLEELIQAPGAPNLYWALANLPRPFLEIASSMEGEKHLLEKEIPQLKTLDSGVWSIDQAHAFSDVVQKKMAMLTGDWARTSSSSTQPDLKDFGSHLLFTALVARSYPEAKRFLISQGRSPAEVEAMPAIQAVALQSYKLYEEARDDIFKWIGLPFWQGYKGMSESVQNPRAGWPKLKSGIPFAVTLPAIETAYLVPVRVDRRLDVIQAIEAIRLYAARHEGRLPAVLEAIGEAPVPTDPATRKPFEYKVDGSTATITAPPPPGFEHVRQYRFNYELKLSR